ncbi:adenylate cyclase [bacterium CG17_big_fil_post_rev_8_21_14_2_50_64_8]|nr:MAG: adenylate cyclase [bacterium CG17_big_fil_post_rev_8_21_14_2_50_64_8]PJA73436.1 MAG: adenylate cyclase [bacterium CG_4_9_14_3_um_filter_65_15]
MGWEIERKFLVRGDDWRAGARGELCRQGYLSSAPERVVRVRIMGVRANLTIKGLAVGLTRPEFEYAIPPREAEELLKLCEQPLIEKTRYRVSHAGLVWEVDEFHGANAGLVLAECELEAEEQAIIAPDWVGEDVSGDSRYFNANLVNHPFSAW